MALIRCKLAIGSFPIVDVHCKSTMVAGACLLHLVVDARFAVVPSSVAGVSAVATKFSLWFVY